MAAQKTTTGSTSIDKIITEAGNLARAFMHSHLTPEHILAVLLRDKDIEETLSAHSKGAFLSLQSEAETSLHFRLDQVKPVPPTPSRFTGSILMQLYSNPKGAKALTAADLFLAFYSAKASIATHILLKHGFDETTARTLFDRPAQKEERVWQEMRNVRGKEDAARLSAMVG
jgi:ATP-dependent Clp protease ATP-binding subunit ClpA